MKVGLSDGIVVYISDLVIAQKITWSLVKNHLVTPKDHSAEIVLKYMMPMFTPSSVYKHTLSGAEDINNEVFEFIRNTLQDKDCVVNKMDLYIGGYTINGPVGDGVVMIDLLLYFDGVDEKVLYRF